MDNTKDLQNQINKLRECQNELFYQNAKMDIEKSELKKRVNDLELTIRLLSIFIIFYIFLLLSLANN